MIIKKLDVNGVWLVAKVSRFEGNVGPGGEFMAAAPRNGPHFAATFLCHQKTKRRSCS